MKESLQNGTKTMTMPAAVGNAKANELACTSAVDVEALGPSWSQEDMQLWARLTMRMANQKLLNNEGIEQSVALIDRRWLEARPSIPTEHWVDMETVVKEMKESLQNVHV